MKEIIELLKELKFNINTRGFMYWLYAIEENKANGTGLLEIYKILSKKERVSMQNIEGSMRYTRCNSDRVIRKYFNYKGKLTNSIILKLINLKEV